MVDLVNDIQIGIGSEIAKRGAAKVRAALDSIRRKSKQVATSGTKDSKKWVAGLKRMAKIAGVVATAFAFRGIIKSQIAFGQAVSDLSAITGAVGEDLEFLRQKSKEFGETTTLSATQAAEAFKIIASGKPDLLENVEALALVTEEAIALAEATGETLPSAAGVMTASLNQFGASAEEASRFINVLAAGSKRGAALVGEMGESLKAVGIIASQAGLSFEETNAALQLMSTRALKGSEAGMQMRGVLLALTASSGDQFKPEVVGLTAALDNLAAAGLDQGSEALKLFGRRNLAAAKTLIQNRDQLGKLTGMLTGTNIAYEQQAIRVDNLSGDIKALKSAYEGLELTIGAKLNSALRSLTQSATESIRVLSKNPLLQKGTGAALDFIHRAVQDIGLAFDSLGDILSTTFSSQIETAFSVWEFAIDKIISAAKFLWNEFVVRGPANAKLGFILMIEAADIFRSHLVEKFKLSVLAVERLFQLMANAVGDVFDGMKTFIGKAIDSIIGAAQQRLFGLARSLGALGFDDFAEDIINLSKALGGMAGNEDNAAAAAAEHTAIRKAELAVIDAMIVSVKATGAAQRAASTLAIALAIEERDATVAVIEALRTKRKEIEDGAMAASTGAPGQTTDPAEEGIEAIKELGEIQENVIDSMSDGIAEFAAKGKLDFKDFANSVIQDIIRMAVKAQALKIFGDIFSKFGLGGLSGGGVPFPTGGVGAGGSFIPSPTLNARHGAQFKVGGHGGPDSQPVSFNASPDETVTITKPGQSKGGDGINLNFEYTIIADGADAEKFQAQVPAMLEKTRQAAVADILLMKKKGVFLTP